MSDSEKIDARLSRVYDNPGDKQALFDDWALTYDHDLVNEMGYVADAEACRRLEASVPERQARILDAGCGTGLVGRRLQQAGYTDIHGSDYSEKMLAEARACGAYRSLQQHDLTQPIETDQLYDAAIVVGVFAFSVPSAEHLVNITCSLKPDGVALVTVNGKAWREADWPARLECFDEKYPQARLVEVQTIDYLTAEGIDGRLLILQRIE
ncbi:MAG: methyltransferase domain-containing protein [Gammaproteobacteria bacterium]|nr:methyltransferase domain-containing protein [Gammaproteobacteria bacterium]